MIFSDKLFRLYFYCMAAMFMRYKPSLKRFQSLPLSDQFYWLSKKYPDYADLCYGEGYLGVSYPINDALVQDYEYQPEEYGVVDILRNRVPALSDDRARDILAGSKLSQEELDVVIEAIAENDTDGWWGHHGFEIELADQTVFTHFIGRSLGQGGVDFEYCGTFNDAQSLKDWIERQPLGQLDWMS